MWTVTEVDVYGFVCVCVLLVSGADRYHLVVLAALTNIHLQYMRSTGHGFIKSLPL